MAKTKYKNSFDKIVFENRWAQRHFMRPGDWTIIGIHKRWFSWNEFEYRICFFGFELRVWFFRELIQL